MVISALGNPGLLLMRSGITILVYNSIPSFQLSSAFFYLDFNTFVYVL